jgi:ribosome-binding protein aMBF1 (putative translation factor)
LSFKPMTQKRLKGLKMLISKRIVATLNENEWKQQMLADKLGKPKSYISKIISGEANLTLRTIVELEDALKTQLIEAKGGET